MARRLDVPLDPGEFVNQRLVILIGIGARPSPGKTRDFLPGRFRRQSSMANQIGRVRQARTMMAGHAVKEDRLPGRVGEQVGGFAHLLDSRRGSTHRNNQPAYARFLDDLGLCHKLGIVAIDGGERDNGFDPFTGNNRLQRGRPLPGPADETPRNHDPHVLFQVATPDDRKQGGARKHHGRRDPVSELTGNQTPHNTPEILTSHSGRENPPASRILAAGHAVAIPRSPPTSRC